MPKEGEERGKFKNILLTVMAIVFIVVVILPLTFSVFDASKMGNVARIPINGPITGDGSSYLGENTVSSRDIVSFIQEAEQNSQIKVIILEINSPGGSAVASDEIASAVKQAQKPVMAVIREVGASGGYWIASATDHIIANKMSITGSIGVISSYLEFSGLMEKYGVGYERLVAGKYKDVGTPFRELDAAERTLLQKKLDRIQEFFIEEIAANRDLTTTKVESLATGEFYLGVEALELGLVDELGDMTTAENYITEQYGLEKIDYVLYQREAGLLDLLASVFSDVGFHIGTGIGSIFIQHENPLFLV